MVGFKDADQSRTIDLVRVCSACRRAFAADAWTVVDVQRAELLERAAAGTLHDVRCPHCGAEDKVDEPCLIHRGPASRPTTIFVPAAHTNPAEDARSAAELAATPDGTPPPPVTWTPRHLVGAVLRDEPPDDPDHVLLLRAADAADREDPLTDAVSALVGTRSLAETAKAVSRHPELLTDRADAHLAEMVEHFAQAAPEDSTATVVQRRLDVLRLIRKLGVREAQARREEELMRVLGAEEELPRELEPAFAALNAATAQRGREGEAIKLVEDILRRLGPERAPRLWGQLHGLLGQLLIEHRSRWRRGKMLERAIEAYTIARDVHEDTQSLEWTWAQKNLSLVYLQRSHGDRAENIRLAIEGLEATANRQGELGEIEECIETLLVLADALGQYCPEENRLERILGLLQTVSMIAAGQERTTAFAEAEQRLKALLESASDPAAIGAIHGVLGTALVERATTGLDEQGAVADRAIFHLSEATRVHSHLGDLSSWSEESIALGQAYYLRVSDSRAADLDLAIGAIEVGLRQLPPETDPEHLAMGRRQLALAYIEHPSRENRWQLAREELQKAPDGLGADGSAHVRATLLQALANVSIRKARADDDESEWRRARDELATAVGALPADENPWVWAEIQGQLSSVLAMLAVHYGAAPDDAIVTTKSVLGVYTLERAPQKRRVALTNLGTLHAARGDWEAARQAYSGAVDASIRALADARTESGRLAETRDAARAYSGLAHALALSGRSDEAYAVAERGWARLTGQWLAPEAIGETTPDDRESLDALRRGTRALEADARRPPQDRDRPPQDDLDERLRKARVLYDTMIDDDGIQEALSADLLLRLAPPGGAAVVPVLADYGGMAMIVPAGTEDVTDRNVVVLDGVNRDSVRDLLFGSPEEPGWIVLRSVLRGDRGTPEDVAFRSRFDEATEELVEKLGEMIVAPVTERLAELGVLEGAHVLIVAQGELSSLPLHAAPLPGGGALLDRYAVSYAPSLLTFAAAYRRAAALSEAPGDGRVLAIIDPTGDLEGTEAEAAALEDAFGSRRLEVLRGEAASVDTVVERASGARYVHFACHGAYDLGLPFRSGLVLADREVLTIDWVATRLALRDARLVVMSACDSGISDVLTAPTEALGLPSALIEAGAAGVVGSMWSVSDEQSAEIMRRFYGLHLGEGMRPVDALRRAQLEARERSTYAGPYLWAAFFVIGP